MPFILISYNLPTGICWHKLAKSIQSCALVVSVFTPVIHVPFEFSLHWSRKPLENGHPIYPIFPVPETIMVLLMVEILHHLRWLKPYKS